MDFCTTDIVSDTDNGGWLVVCNVHGRIATRDTIGRAEAMMYSHRTQFRSIDGWCMERDCRAKPHKLVIQSHAFGGR